MIFAAYHTNCKPTLNIGRSKEEEKQKKYEVQRWTSFTTNVKSFCHIINLRNKIKLDHFAYNDHSKTEISLKRQRLFITISIQE